MAATGEERPLGEGGRRGDRPPADRRTREGGEVSLVGETAGTGQNVVTSYDELLTRWTTGIVRRQSYCRDTVW